jgi:dihydrofolate reductase
MIMRNKVFIATSLDGFIADDNGGIDWLTELPNPSSGDGGYTKFIDSIDAIVMGRNTFQKVLSFGIDWPYAKKVFVWSNTLKQIPSSLEGKVEIVFGSIEQILHKIQEQGFKNLYIDGGKTIQSFLQAGLIQEIILTQVPIILGRGIPLFQGVPKIKLTHKSTEAFDNGMVQVHYEVRI